MKNVTAVALSGLLLFATSCATIVSKSSYPVTINSAPSEAKIVIKDKKGIEVFKGQTPATLKLNAGSGFFSKAHYQVEFSKKGYETMMLPINFKLDGWYFGNILFGGFIGFLIIDPATGAMWKLDTEFINATLIQSESASTIEKKEMKIYSLNEIPAEWKKHLVKIK